MRPVAGNASVHCPCASRREHWQAGGSTSYPAFGQDSNPRLELTMVRAQRFADFAIKVIYALRTTTGASRYVNVSLLYGTWYFLFPTAEELHQTQPFCHRVLNDRDRTLTTRSRLASIHNEPTVATRPRIAPRVICSLDPFRGPSRPSIPLYSR